MDCREVSTVKEINRCELLCIAVASSAASELGKEEYSSRRKG